MHKGKNMNVKKTAVILCLAAILSGTAMADIIVQYQPTSGYGTGTTGANQLLAKVTVGAEDVEIGGFGVYGQAQAETTLKWVIFDVTQLSSPVFLSDAVIVPANPGTFTTYAQWHDSPNMDFTLLANHTYAMGVLSNRYGTDTFYWGQDYFPFGGNPTVTAGGLSLTPGNYIVNSGIVGTEFVNVPTLYNLAADARFHTAMRIAEPVPSDPDPIAGDYNEDGYVDLADYTVWADSFGQTGSDLSADGNGDEFVDLADYTIWADNFGQGTPPAN
jgi:hypothetical protein